MKRKRATLESDSLRDNRMGVTDIRRGSIPAPPPTQDIQSPPMPCKLRGFGGRAPDSKPHTTSHHDIFPGQLTLTDSLGNDTTVCDLNPAIEVWD